MADENTELLREIATLLKQSADDRRKAMGDAVDTLRGGPLPDLKKRQEETDQRMQELKEKSEQHRQAIREYQESVLSELRKISTMLEQMQRRSGGAG
jgi:hypothetical protein